MFMRLCTPVTLCLAAAAVLLPVPAYAEAGPSCAGPDTGAFPLTTRLHGGPDSYRAGGGYGTWYLDLTNTTRRTCADVHPVVVLVDAERALKPSQPHLEYYADGRPQPVRFETTDEDELVGAFTSGPGFTVAPGRTVTVELRLALTSDTAPNDVTVNAAVVQRHGDDGDWVGQSNDYRFSVEADPRPDSTPEPDADDSASTAAPEPDDSASTAASGAPDAGRLTLADEAAELARTGLASPAGLTAATCCFLAAGAALLLSRRRR
ncbi:hypothetical protein OG562_15810 [Streptomyces sp. NBC_01275]|uniref:hypothetical protein n=1 Tax=Streptomyces sp. NBC_01275 TaxID=2903807 RepID=UPI00224FA4D2|nr:hypothetical protein [Streptomyces sp. NBC_01275]MCX4762415.1 hypothetical protein [Streptomyces sp. NBC_01275]